LKTVLKLSASQHCHLAIFSAFKTFAHEHVRENPSVFFQNDDYQFTFNDLNSDKNFVNNDVLNSFVVNFDNFCKNTFKIRRTPQSRSYWSVPRLLFFVSKIRNMNLLRTKCSAYLTKDHWTPNS